MRFIAFIELHPISRCLRVLLPELHIVLILLYLMHHDLLLFHAQFLILPSIPRQHLHLFMLIVFGERCRAFLVIPELFGVHITTQIICQFIMDSADMHHDEAILLEQESPSVMLLIMRPFGLCLLEQIR